MGYLRFVFTDLRDFKLLLIFLDDPRADLQRAEAVHGDEPETL